MKSFNLYINNQFETEGIENTNKSENIAYKFQTSCFPPEISFSVTLYSTILDSLKT